MTGLLGTLFPLDLEGGDSKINLDDSCCAPRLIAKIISLEPLGKTAEMHRLDKLIPGAVQNYSSTSVASSTRDGSGVGGMENCGTGSNVSLVSANKSTTVAASLGPGVTIRPLSPTKLALQKVLGGIRGVWETVGLGAGGSGGGGGIPGGPYENGLNQHMEATGTMVMPGLGSVNRRDGIEEEREVVRVKAGWEFSSSSKLGRINELAIGEREFRGVVEWRVEYEYEGSK